MKVLFALIVVFIYLLGECKWWPASEENSASDAISVTEDEPGSEESKDSLNALINEETAISTTTDVADQANFFKNRFDKINKKITSYKKFHDGWKSSVKKSLKSDAAKKWSRLMGQNSVDYDSGWYKDVPPFVSNKKQRMSIIEHLQRLFKGLQVLDKTIETARVDDAIQKLKTCTPSVGNDGTIAEEKSGESISELLKKVLQEMQDASNGLKSKLGISD